MKKIRICIICAVLAGALICFNYDHILNYFWQKIDERIDYERSLEVGDDFNKVSWGNLNFQINHHKTGNNLEYVNAAEKEVYILLENIASYKISDDKLYVKSSDGYAVIDENDFCKIFADGLKNEQSDNYTQDQNGNKVYDLQVFKNDSIKYLSKYDEFETGEKKSLKNFDLEVNHEENNWHLFNCPVVTAN